MSTDVFQFAGQDDAFLRTAEAVQSVHNPQQLFVWLRLHLHRYVPHDLMICQVRPVEPGAEPVAQVFNTLPLPEPLLGLLAEPRGPFLSRLRRHWLDSSRQPQTLLLDGLADEPAAQGLREAGYRQLTLHACGEGDGVQPPLLLVCAQQVDTVAPATRALGLALWLPHLHFALARVCAARRGPAPALQTDHGLTPREMDILVALRAALSNHDIGERLGISALTVKNHLRKMMRKLDAHNRVQLVAEAMSRRWIV